MVSTISIPLPIIDQVNQHSIEGAIMEMQPANNITRPISITTVGNPRLTPTQTVLKNKRSIRRLVITLKTILVLLGHPLLIIRISPPPNLGMIAITNLINITLPPFRLKAAKPKHLCILTIIHTILVQTIPILNMNASIHQNLCIQSHIETTPTTIALRSMPPIATRSHEGSTTSIICLHLFQPLILTMVRISIHHPLPPGVVAT